MKTDQEKENVIFHRSDKGGRCPYIQVKKEGKHMNEKMQSAANGKITKVKRENSKTNNNIDIHHMVNKIIENSNNLTKNKDDKKKDKNNAKNVSNHFVNVKHTTYRGPG